MAVPEFKAIIFDCFGVLYLDAKQSLLNTVPADRSQELADIFMQNNYGMMSRSDYIKAVAKISGMSEEEFETFTKHEHRLNSALIAHIHELKKNYKVGLLSNIGRDWITDFFDTHQLHDLFDEVVLSGDEGITKPHPRIYEIMAERIGFEPGQCLMIDDIQANCDGADAAGMQTIHYRNNEQLRKDLKRLHIL